MRARSIVIRVLLLTMSLLAVHPLAALAAPPAGPAARPWQPTDRGLQATAGSWHEVEGGSAWEQVHLYQADGGELGLYVSAGSVVADGEGYVAERWLQSGCGNPVVDHGAIDPTLGGAWVDQDVEVTGYRCVPDADEPDGERCELIGEGTVHVAVTWVGTGRVTRSTNPWRGEDGSKWMYRAESREGTVTGGIGGELLEVDLGGLGGLERWTVTTHIAPRKR
jgi:hypothetical protein